MKLASTIFGVRVHLPCVPKLYVLLNEGTLREQ